MNRHYSILPYLCCLLLLNGCATKPSSHQPVLNQHATQAESFRQSGQHKQAATLYQSLAKSEPAQQQHYSLLAAEAYTQAGNSQAAETVLEAINSTKLSAQQRNRLNLLYAQIKLSNGEAEQALDKLDITQAYKLDPAEKITYYQSLAFAHSLMGNLLQSAQARIKLTPLLETNELVSDNNQVILNTLKLLPLQTLTLDQPPAPDVLGGWMALTTVLKTQQTSKDLANLKAQITDWQTLYPYHPANSDFLLSLLEGKKHNFALPSAIAVLLPESGRFARAGNIIKEGLMAAYHASVSDFQPPLRFYDSGSDSPISLYHQAINEGAEMIIGPLSKNNIETLALSIELTIPVLALNHIPNLAKDNLFQFGLSPIDNAIEISKQASQNNHENVLLLTPDNNQGRRIAQNLQENWEASGGIILEQQSYNPKESDFSQPIKYLLNLDESKARYQKLKRLLAHNIQFTERRRQDVDAIFMAATPQTARSIYPQLQFYRATRVPVFAASNIYSGHPNPSQDIDLNSITFCDIPWLFAETYSGELSLESLRNTWEKLPRRYIRLLALGIDSFTIITHLNQLDSILYAGATGALSLNMENRITRQLACAKFVNGKPELQQYAPIEPGMTSDDEIIYSEEFIQ